MEEREVKFSRNAIEERAIGMWTTLLATADHDDAETAAVIEADPQQKMALLHGIRLGVMAAIEALRDVAEG